jgi:hypothetical protein
VSCTKVQPRKPINPKPSTTIYDEARQQNKILNKIEDNKIVALIKEDSTNTYIQSSNGFWYTYINKIEEDLPSPKNGDEVVFEYDIKDLNDSIIYSKEELASYNAFGITGDNRKIGINQSIKSTVTLININK